MELGLQSKACFQAVSEFRDGSLGSLPDTSKNPIWLWEVFFAMVALLFGFIKLSVLKLGCCDKVLRGAPIWDGLSECRSFSR